MRPPRLTADAARESINRSVATLDAGELTIGEGRGVDEGACLLAFRVGLIAVARSSSTKVTVDENLIALSIWLSDRVWSISHGIETWREAFFDCATVPDEGHWDLPPAPRRAFTTTTGIPESIATIRGAIARLHIPERDVTAVWDREKNYARWRMHLPSGEFVEKVSRAQKNADTNLAALAQWLRRRSLGWARGTENLDLDRVFAGNIVPGARRAR